MPVPPRRLDVPFLMPVESVLTINGRGTVVTGAVEQGVIGLWDAVDLVGLADPGTAVVRSVVTGLETFGKALPQAQAGDNAALLLRGVRRHETRRGQVLCAAGTVHPRLRFQAQLRVLAAVEGGRRKGFADGYRPQFHLRTADVVGRVVLLDDGTAQPGSAVEVEVEVEVLLGVPVALSVGLGFAVREGGRTVAAGTVTRLLE